MQKQTRTTFAELSVFAVVLFNEESAQVMTDEVLAPNSNVAIGVAATERKDESDHIVICVKDESGNLTYPGNQATYISDIIQQDLFSSGISQKMLSMMVDQTNTLIDRELLVERGINTTADEDEENVYTLYSMLEDLAEQMDETFTIDEDEFVGLFTALYPRYDFGSATHAYDVSLNFTVDGPLDEHGKESLYGIDIEKIRERLHFIIDNETESDLRSRLEVFNVIDIEESLNGDD